MCVEYEQQHGAYYCQLPRGPHLRGGRHRVRHAAARLLVHTYYI